MTPPDSTNIIRIDTGLIIRRKTSIPMEAHQKPDTNLVLTEDGHQYIITNQFGQSFTIDHLWPKALAITAPDPDPLAIPSAFDSILPHEPLQPINAAEQTAKYKALLEKPAHPSFTGNKAPEFEEHVHAIGFVIILLTSAVLAQRIYNLFYEVRKDLRVMRGAATVAGLRNEKADKL